ncbi:MAG: DedA family protein [Rhodocyclaceae bacterium]|nr:DedA family protein [Rhodocyclaceae bacterium]
MFDLSFSPEAGLAGLFAAAFVSATLLPGGSEALLLALVRLHPEQALPALAVTTLGNVLGGMTTYATGRLLPERALHRLSPRSLEGVRRYGSPSLLLSWAPLFGDALCLAAGWLRLPWPGCALWMSVGKGVRYALVVAGAGAF